MLPDLPNIKRDISHILYRYFQIATQRRMGAFANAPRHQIHEGASMRILRADGTIEESALKEASAELTLKFEEIPNMSVEARMAKLDEMAESMAKQMSEHLYSRLNETLEKAGQVVDNKGTPLSHETFFALLEKLQVDFDKNGNPKGLQLVIGPGLVPRIKELIEQEKSDLSITKRHEEIMARKRLEWRDREAARKLVG